MFRLGKIVFDWYLKTTSSTQTIVWKHKASALTTSFLLKVSSPLSSLEFLVGILFPFHEVGEQTILLKRT